MNVLKPRKGSIEKIFIKAATKKGELVINMLQSHRFLLFIRQSSASSLNIA